MLCLTGALAVKGGLNFSGGIFSSKWCDAEYRGGLVGLVGALWTWIQAIIVLRSSLEDAAGLGRLNYSGSIATLDGRGGMGGSSRCGSSRRWRE